MTDRSTYARGGILLLSVYLKPRGGARAFLDYEYNDFGRLNFLPTEEFTQFVIVLDLNVIKPTRNINTSKAESVWMPY